MVTVMEQAAELLSGLLKERAIPLGQGFRITNDPVDGFILVIGEAAEGDQVVEHQGAVVLMVGDDVAEVLDGAVIDSYDTPRGRFSPLGVKHSGSVSRFSQF